MTPKSQRAGNSSMSAAAPEALRQIQDGANNDLLRRSVSKWPFLLSDDWLAPIIGCWWHCSVSHLLLGQRHTWDLFRTLHHLTYISAVPDVALRYPLTCWSFSIFVERNKILRCACVHPQECCVKMVTNGILNEKRMSGGLKKGIGE